MKSQAALSLPILLTLTQSITPILGYALFYVPGANITKLESTFTVPPLSTTGGFHALWPGLEPTAENFVYQNVIDDDQPDGTWGYSTWEVESGYIDGPVTTVYEGDVISSTFTLNPTTAVWTDVTSIVPGSAGVNAGETASGSTTTTVIDANFPGIGPLTQALFVIELQDNAVWDFGRFYWQDITMVAATSETSWCTSPIVSPSFTYTTSTPVITVNGASSTCYIANMIFVSPDTDSTTSVSGSGDGVIRGPISSI